MVGEAKARWSLSEAFVGNAAQCCESRSENRCGAISDERFAKRFLDDVCGMNFQHTLPVFDFLANGCEFAFVDNEFLLHGIRCATTFARTLTMYCSLMRCSQIFWRTVPATCFSIAAFWCTVCVLRRISDEWSTFWDGLHVVRRIF